MYEHSKFRFQSNMKPNKNPVVFLDINIGSRKGRVVLELFKDVVPKTAENFRALCTGEKGSGVSGKPLHYKGSIFHKAVSEFMIQGGDITMFDGTGGESIYGLTFKDENFKLKHHSAGMLSMAKAGSDCSSSQFFITTIPCDHLDGVNVVFGEVRKGLGVVEEVSRVGTHEDRPFAKCWIEDCGELGHNEEEWGIGEADGTADVYPSYPTDWNASSQQLEIDSLETVITKIKNSGNYFFKVKEFVCAGCKYQKALRYIEWSRSKLKEIQNDPKQKNFVDAELICLLNSAAVSLKRKLFREALESCDLALKIDSKCVKALYRRAQAKQGLYEYEAALKDLRKAYCLSRNDKMIHREICSLRKLMMDYLTMEKIRCEKMFK
ncbi:uncharacterized protein LOC110829236 isoform X2 [Zootermopsis nevadensis]|uniref:uncharacterized protein LOC110829236 isoform X2 n=1 Tax=Zootermopsis nevadensis TaxID=136037 RepID=UPI000B8E6441|nr:uncharacterized protein LOC110829236 isoform X2 [Zootermopsis nevadensis]